MPPRDHARRRAASSLRHRASSPVAALSAFSALVALSVAVSSGVEPGAERERGSGQGSAAGLAAAGGRPGQSWTLLAAGPDGSAAPDAPRRADRDESPVRDGGTGTDSWRPGAGRGDEARGARSTVRPGREAPNLYVGELPVNTLIAPAQGVVLPGGDFGWRIAPDRGGREFHNGTDVSAAAGLPVVAALDGTVTAVFWDVWGGNRVEVTHADGLKTTYNHLADVRVRTGDRLAASEQLGSVGSTGLRTTGPHLHFETWIHGRAVDPQSFDWLDGSRVIPASRSKYSLEVPPLPGTDAAADEQQPQDPKQAARKQREKAQQDEKRQEKAPEQREPAGTKPAPQPTTGKPERPAAEQKPAPQAPADAPAAGTRPGGTTPPAQDPAQQTPAPAPGTGTVPVPGTTPDEQPDPAPEDGAVPDPAGPPATGTPGAEQPAPEPSAPAPAPGDPADGDAPGAEQPDPLSGVQERVPDELRDTDGDGELDVDEGTVDDDLDGDGLLNHEDPDLDGDGVPNELDDDLDGDGLPNAADPDIDGDGLPNEEDPEQFVPAAPKAPGGPAAGKPAAGTPAGTPADTAPGAGAEAGPATGGAASAGTEQVPADAPSPAAGTPAAG